MRARNRRREPPKGSFGDRAKNAGVLLAGLVFFVMALCAASAMGLEPLLSAHRDRTIQRQVIAGGTSASHGEGPVLLRGHIDPRQPVPVGGGGLALVERESWRTNYTWGLEFIDHPEFKLVLADGSVLVVNGCRREDNDLVGGLFNLFQTLGFDDCYRLGGKSVVVSDGNGRRRYFGFRPGDEVHVAGTLRGGRLHASSVFGGSPEDYAATLRNSPWSLIVGLAFGLALVVTSVMLGYIAVCCARRPAGLPARGAG